DDGEKALLRQLSVFAGPFTLESASAVCGEKDQGGRMKDEAHGQKLHPSSFILHPLSRLVDKSLVTVDASAGEARYRLLDTTREYGRELLASRGEWDRMRQRHAEYFHDIVSMSATRFTEQDADQAIARLE